MHGVIFNLWREALLGSTGITLSPPASPCPMTRCPLPLPPFPLPPAPYDMLHVDRIGSPLNPGGIVPIGPSVDDLGLEEAAGRGSQDGSAVFWSKECVPPVPAHFGHDSS